MLTPNNRKRLIIQSSKLVMFGQKIRLPYLRRYDEDHDPRSHSAAKEPNSPAVLTQLIALLTVPRSC